MTEAPVAQRMAVGDAQEERREIEIREGGQNAEDKRVPKVLAPSFRRNLGKCGAGDKVGQGCRHGEIIQADYG